MSKTLPLTTCQACQKQFLPQQLCLKCQNQDQHHELKVPKNTCQQCLEKGLQLIKEWNGKWYCWACTQWNQEANQAGIGTYCRRFRESYCQNCGHCASCLARAELTTYSTRDLMLEVMNRDNFAALLSWEDDSFKQRYGEIMWELDQVKGLTPPQIRKLVDQDVMAKKLSIRKFSRGT